MGALRTRNGHPEPYRIKYWQVGNEQSGPDYERRLPEFCKAMKQADPSIELMSSYPKPGVIRGAGEWLDYVSPHHYDCADLAGCESELESDPHPPPRAGAGPEDPGRGHRVEHDGRRLPAPAGRGSGRWRMPWPVRDTTT